MRYVRGVDEKAVISANDDPRATLELLRTRPIRELYLLDPPEVASSVVLYPDGSGRSGPIATALTAWRELVSNGNPGAIDSVAKVLTYQDILRSGMSFRDPPILQDESLSVHAGRRRLLAAYECWVDGSAHRSIEVYWVRARK